MQYIQIYGCFFPGDLVAWYSIKLLFMNELQYLESSLLVAMSDKRLGIKFSFVA